LKVSLCRIVERGKGFDELELSSVSSLPFLPSFLTSSPYYNTIFEHTQVVEVKDGVIWLARLKVPSGVSQSQVISGKIVFETNFPMQPLLELPIFAAVEKQRL
jgi:hypothetical protein